ncbi:MAG: phosphoglycerate dehydrogenase [Ilumatobacteraceae bacterium]|jgi:D-3-phosphoglycerate dehydrogenase|nr:phosphoglycerate dehydrogenase [Ilumatobacteraceae bacterium]
MEGDASGVRHKLLIEVNDLSNQSGRTVPSGENVCVARVLVSEELAERGLDRLRAAGHEVDVRVGLSPEELRGVIKGASALIVRSATQVDDALLEAGSELVVVGRAGVGLDNVDVEAATKRGVMVANAPESNIVSAAEHTLAMLLAVARNVPQAHAALVQGRWERSRWEGVELLDKTLGIAGLGRIGKLVAQRAAAFGMRIIAFDPFVSVERARAMNIELVDIDRLVQESDFLTIHLPKTKETVGLIGRDMLLKAKPNLRVVNVARGGIVDEEALAEAVSSGVIAGAALDVFAKEPTTESPLFSVPGIVVTPHLGASTTEAQDKAGDDIADMINLALAGDFVPYAVNISAADANETMKPFLPLAERLGRLLASMFDATPSSLEVIATGEIGSYDTRILTLAAEKGFFSAIHDEPVTFVNAPQVAASLGVEVKESKVPTGSTSDYVNLVTLRAGTHSIAATLVGPRRQARIVMVDDHVTDVPPADNMLVVRNDDRPGVIGLVGTLLGNAGVNIADMDVGRALTPGTALMVIAPTAEVTADVLDQLRAAPGIIEVTTLRA